MDFGTVVTLAQTIMAALESQKIKDMSSAFGYKSELKELQNTISTVKAVLLDAESQQERLCQSHEAQHFIAELKDAVYDADDLLDEFVALAERKLRMKGGKFAKKVRLFFSRYNQICVAFYMSRGVKHTRTTLDAIASNHGKFGLSLDHKPVKRRREETCSHVYANDIIGREADVERVVGMLLDCSSVVERDVSCLTIVGMGGLGKTTLAQLIYNDERVKSAFPLRLWACDGDQDVNHLDIETVLRKILASDTGDRYDNSTMEYVQKRVRELLKEDKFLLVLDDVWNENRDEWLNLERFFKGGQKGSRVLVTTRSINTARVVGNGLMHKLEGLSDDSSWRLFKKIAFQEIDAQGIPCYNDLVKTGREIVRRCANVPLSIRAVGSLLYGQDKTKWDRVLKTELADIKDSKKGIMPILKLSYDNLEVPVKSCFNYCAVFPKNFEIDKDMLLELWLAQGFVVPLVNDQNIEDAVEDYFLFLLQRCFFQDVKKDKWGKIVSFKIHDLMHDIAREVSRDEILEVSGSTLNDTRERVRHVSIVGHNSNRSSIIKARIRTFLQVGKAGGIDEFLVDELLANCLCLRTLDLRNSKFKSLPKSIGKLLHLRYLNLSGNQSLEVLPKSITGLHNLLVLGIRGCYSLTYLPLGIGKLTCLRRLETFMAGQASSSEKQCFDELEGLRALNDLEGYLNIQIGVPTDATSDKSRKETCEYLSEKEHLDTVGIIVKHVQTKEYVEGCDKFDFEEALLQKLKPHSSLKNLILYGYQCTMA